MNFELYIHGATNGQKVLCSKEEDVYYCKNFYANTIKNNNLFRVDIRHNNSYYSFIKYDLIGGDNRRGGYFGITLRIDNNFCDSIDKLYPYFISLYNKYIEGKIIKGDRYLVNDLPEQTRKDIENEFGNILSDLKYSLKPINNSFSKQKDNTTLPSYNIKEISNYNYVAILQKNLSILLSDEFPTKDAILSDTQKELNELKSSTQKQLNELNQTIDLYKDKNQKKQSEINTLKETMSKIKGQIEENKSLKSFEDNIKAIETPINNIATYLKQYSENATDGSKKTNTNKLIKKLILPIIIAGLLLANCVMYFRVNSRLKNIETIEQQTETTTTTESSTTKDTTKDNTEEVTQETTNEDNIEAENESPRPLPNHDKNKKNENIKKN